MLAHKLQSSQTQATQSDLILQLREQSFHLLSLSLCLRELARLRQPLQLRKTAEAAIEQAVRDGEISIHRAWLWSYDSPQRQLENLRLRRLETGLKAKAKTVVAQHQSQTQGLPRDPRFFTLPELAKLVALLSGETSDTSSTLRAAFIATVDVPGVGIFISRDLVEGVKEKHKGLSK